MVEQHLSDNSTDILFQQASDVIWVPYNKLHVSNYRKVHHDKMSDVIVLKVESQKNTFTRAILSKFLADSNELLRIRDNISGTGCALACTECTCTPGSAHGKRCTLNFENFQECTLFLRVLQESAHFF